MVFSIKVRGLNKSKLFLQGKKLRVEKQAKQGIVRASVFLQGEVKDSIAGRRAEGPFVTKTRPTPHPSVDTGQFLNSVAFQTNKLVGKVFSSLPYAAVLEFGSGKRKARRHFGNSANRNKQKIISIIQASVNKI